MSDDEIHVLSELAAQFRVRADTARRMRDKYQSDAAHISWESPYHHTLKKDAERLEGKRQAYANDADDLERFIRTFTPTAEASEKGGE